VSKYIIINVHKSFPNIVTCIIHEYLEQSWSCKLCNDPDNMYGGIIIKTSACGLESQLHKSPFSVTFTVLRETLPCVFDVNDCSYKYESLCYTNWRAVLPFAVWSAANSWKLQRLWCSYWWSATHPREWQQARFRVSNVDMSDLF